MILDFLPVGRHVRGSMRKIASGKNLVQDRVVPTSLKLADVDVLLLYTFALFAVGGIQRFLDAYLYAAQRTAFDAVMLHEVNAGEFLAFVALVSVLKSKAATAVRLSRVDLAVISACAMFFLFPKQSLPFVGATIAGVYFWRHRPYNAQLASVGQLWLAISVYRLWGRLFFQVVCAPIIQAEVFVIAKIGQLLGLGLSLDGIRIISPNGWFVYLMDGCSSFHNASLAVLVWLSLVKLARSRVSSSKLMALGIGILAIVCLNAFRILLMTPSEEAYLFWHEGSGAILFSCLTLGAIAVPTIISLRLRS
jgi:exosortase/archaeosortase family protein